MKTTPKATFLTIALLTAACTSSNAVEWNTATAQPLTSLLTQLTADSKSAADTKLQSLGGDLGGKIQSLTQPDRRACAFPFLLREQGRNRRHPVSRGDRRKAACASTGG